MANNNSETERRLWSAADEFRANSELKSCEYATPVLGLIFLRYADHRFTIRSEFRERLYQYIGGIIREKEGVLLEIGGVEDHIHIMAGLPATISVSDMLRFIKSNSSGWVNETFKPAQKFAWQPGYGAFTVSHSQKSAVQNYIQNQEQHHQKRSFQDEFIQILVAHGIEYDPKFVFEEEHHG
jgi:REP element-mobilizing transposase RayT